MRVIIDNKIEIFLKPESINANKDSKIFNNDHLIDKKQLRFNQVFETLEVCCF